jgi:hypothetical protein
MNKYAPNCCYCGDNAEVTVLYGKWFCEYCYAYLNIEDNRQIYDDDMIEQLLECKKIEESK